MHSEIEVLHDGTIAISVPNSFRCDRAQLRQAERDAKVILQKAVEDAQISRYSTLLFLCDGPIIITPTSAEEEGQSQATEVANAIVQAFAERHPKTGS